MMLIENKQEILMDIYQENGYDNRAQYLAALADDYGVSLPQVVALANLLSKNEDFDGLVSAVQEMEPEYI